MVICTCRHEVIVLRIGVIDIQYFLGNTSIQTDIMLLMNIQKDHVSVADGVFRAPRVQNMASVLALILLCRSAGSHSSTEMPLPFDLLIFLPSLSKNISYVKLIGGSPPSMA
jgi:hypothetical protein